MYNQETNDKLSAKSAWWKKRDLDLSYSSVEPNIFCRSLSLSLSRLQIIQIWTSHRSHGVSFKSQDDKNNNLIITYNFQIHIIIVSETSGGTTVNPKKKHFIFSKELFLWKEKNLISLVLLEGFYFVSKTLAKYFDGKIIIELFRRLNIVMHVSSMV